MVEDVLALVIPCLYVAVGLARQGSDTVGEWMTSAAASRTNVGTLRLSVRAFDWTNLGANRRG